MKLIVGLGNPGKEYKDTRHNIGYKVLDNYLVKTVGKVSWKNKLESCFFMTELYNEDVIFIKPVTYMNLSGIAVKKILKYYDVKTEDILVIQDDLDMELGTYKVKKNSSSGGHNGIKSIISELKTEEFARLKIGIGKDERIPVEKYVLARLSTAEEKAIENNYDNFNYIIDLFIKEGIDYTIQNYNK